MRDPFVFEHALEYEVVDTFLPKPGEPWPACAGCGQRFSTLKRYSYENEEGVRIKDKHLFCSVEHRREFYP